MSGSEGMVAMNHGWAYESEPTTEIGTMQSMKRSKV